TTPSDIETAYVGSVKNQHYFAGRELLETGFAFVQYGLDERSKGTSPYFLTPEHAAGNYYLSANTRARRWQALTNLYLPAVHWHGSHEFKMGVDLDRLTYNADINRQSISFLREGVAVNPAINCLRVIPSPCSRYSVFSGGNDSNSFNTESSAYIQDRWLITNRWLLEPGLRFDWDQVIRSPLFSPRVATTYVLDEAGNTKLSAGVAVVYDQTNLLFLARPAAGSRLDYFFNASGLPVDQNGIVVPAPTPVLTTFSVDRRRLREPRFVNWSAGLEQKLPWALYLKVEFLERRGTNGFVFNTVNGRPGGNFVLQNTREDRYHAFQIDARRAFLNRYVVFGSYVRSSARSNQVFDFNVDTSLLSPQAPGPYPWDAPNRFLSWGLVPFFRLPLIHEFDIAYSLEARTGFPFNAVNEQQQVVGAPGSYRFPTYFSLNLQLEKRFHLLGFSWAVRGGFDNITDHKNPLLVNNDINSAQFLTFTGFDRRAFT